MKKKRKRSLRFKFTAVYLIIGIGIVIASLVAGVYTYSASILRSYDDESYRIAKVAASYYTEDEISEYADLARAYYEGKATDKEIRKVTKSKDYLRIKKQLDTLREKFNANDIYVVGFDSKVLHNYDEKADAKDEWNPMYYIADSYHIAEEQLTMGDKGPIVADYINSVISAWDKGEQSDTYILTTGHFGYNMTSLFPITVDHKVVAVVGVEIPVETLKEDISLFIVSTIVTFGVIAAVLMTIGIVYLVRTIIQPIRLVAAEADNFIKNNNQVSDKLDTIRTKDEIQMLSENLLKMEHGINRYIENLTIVTAEKERVGAELDIATRIQASMLPSIFPAFPDRQEFDIYAMMSPAKEVGGDFYDFFMVDEDHLAMVIADVSGKGIPAALFMVIGKTLIKDHTVLGKDLGEVFKEVNEILCESNSEELFITAFEAVLNLKTGELRYVNAGHEIPFICKKAGTFEPYKVRAAFVLAGMEGINYRAGSMQLEPGDKLFLYTDGVPEATDKHNRMFGMKRLEKTLQKLNYKEAKDILHGVKTEVDAFVGEADQFDDLTMLCMEYKQKKES